jgi:hypothetical protein
MATKNVPGDRAASTRKAQPCLADRAAAAQVNLPAWIHDQIPFSPDPVNGWDTAGIDNMSKPPVMVNPEASTEDLIAWARGQLEQATNITGLVVGGSYNDGKGVYLAVESSHHFGLQALVVLSALSTRLQNEAFVRNAQASPAPQPCASSEPPEAGEDLSKLLNDALLLAGGAKAIAEGFEDALTSTPVEYLKLQALYATLSRAGTLITTAQQSIEAREKVHG